MSGAPEGTTAADGSAGATRTADADDAGRTGAGRTGAGRTGAVRVYGVGKRTGRTVGHTGEAARRIGTGAR